MDLSSEALGGNSVPDSWGEGKRGLVLWQGWTLQVQRTFTARCAEHKCVITKPISAPFEELQWSKRAKPWVPEASNRDTWWQFLVKLESELSDDRFISPLDKEGTIPRSQQGLASSKSYLIFFLMLLLVWQLVRWHGHGVSGSHQSMWWSLFNAHGTAGCHDLTDSKIGWNVK